MALKYPITTFGGMNENDQEEVLISKAYDVVDGNVVQKTPLEFRDLTNCDFTKEGLRKRKGSAEYVDFNSASLDILAKYGEVWTERSNPKNFYLRGITYDNGLYVAVGEADGTDAYIVTSPDGITWTERSNPKNFYLSGIVYGGGLYIAVGAADGTDAYIVTSPDDITWTERSNPKNVILFGITYGNGLYVAVGNADGTDAYIVTSPDGITWTERSNPKNGVLYDITYGNGLYVAVGYPDGTDAYIVTSPDGITWTERSNPKNFYLYGITYGNGLYVAVGATDGTDAYIVTSPDGTTWTERSNPKNFPLYDITYGGGLFVAVGYPDGTDAYIVTSPDGITWTERSNPKNFYLRGITYGGGLFVAVGNADGTDAYIVTSSDGDELIAGTQWVDPAAKTEIEVVVSERTIYTNQSGTYAQINSSAGSAFVFNTDITKVGFSKVDGHLFIGVDGADNYIQVYRSGSTLDDPLYATVIPSYVDQDSASGTSVLYVNDETVFIPGSRIVIDEGQANEEYNRVSSVESGYLLLQNNLTNTHSAQVFTERSNPKNFYLRGITYGDGLYVAVGYSDGTDAYIVTSPDGTTWTERSNPKNIALYSITYGNGLYLAVGLTDGTDAYMVTSPDGTTWTERSNPKNFYLHSITYGNGLYVAVGQADGTDAYIVTSPDGTTWTERSNPKNINLYGITYDNGLYVAVGYQDGTDAYIVTSPDGITWTERSNPKNFYLHDITYGNGLFVAVGQADGTDAYIVTSPDGTTWTERSNPKNINLYGITYGNGLYVAVGNADGTDAYIITSPDGTTWTERSNPKNINLYGITYDNGLYVAVGYTDGTDAYIVTAPNVIFVNNANQYTEAFDTSTTHDITGAWDEGTYLIAEFQTRLFMSTGNTLVNYTPQAYTTDSGIWDMLGATAGFLQAAGNIRSINSFAPIYSDQVNDAFYIGTENGFEIISGVTIDDQLVRIEGAKSPINHNCVVKSLNWLVYLTDDKNILAINGANVIDLGRKLKSFGGTGKLDGLDLDSSKGTAYGFYSKGKKQVYFAFDDDGSGDINDEIVVIDFNMGEPVLGEALTSYEERVRCLYWNYGNATPTFYRNVFQTSARAVGIIGTGVLYTLESGNTDLGSENIDTTIQPPEFTGLNQDAVNQWFRLMGRLKSQASGTPQLSLTFKKNRESGSTVTDTWSLLDTEVRQINKYTTLNFRSKIVQAIITSTDAYEWEMLGLSLIFDIGAEILE